MPRGDEDMLSTSTVPNYGRFNSQLADCHTVENVTYLANGGDSSICQDLTSINDTTSSRNLAKKYGYNFSSFNDTRSELNTSRVEPLGSTIDKVVFNKLLDSFGSEVEKTPQVGDPMDWQMRYYDKVDRDMSEIKNSMRDTESRIEARIESTMSEVKEMIHEMRDRDNQRHQEFLNINASLSQMKTDLHESVDSMKKWTIGMVVSVIALVATAIVGIATLVISVLQFLSLS